MTLRFCCPCGQKLKTPDGSEGRRARCPKCGEWLRVPKSLAYEVTAEAVEAKAAGRPEPAHAAEAVAPEPAEEPKPVKARVLVADSNASQRKMTVKMLREHHYGVLETADGAQALEMIRKERPDAAVLNVKLEGMSGFQVLQQLRSLANDLNKDVWNLPTLMTTEKLQGRDKQYSMSLGVEGYFVKPFAAEPFFARLDKITLRNRPR